MSLRSVNANFTRISLRWRQRGNGSQPGAQYLRGDASRAEQDLRSGAAEYAEIGPISSWHVACRGGARSTQRR